MWIGSFLIASQNTKKPSQRYGYGEKFLANEPLKDVTMERMRVEEYEESLCKDCGWVNLVFFFWSFSLKILSKSSQYFVGIRGIYTGVRKECKESVFP